MRTVKTRGALDLAALKRRVKRAYSMERIDRPTYEMLILKIEELEAAIINMRELNEHGEEEG